MIHDNGINGMNDPSSSSMNGMNGHEHTHGYPNRFNHSYISPSMLRLTRKSQESKTEMSIEIEDVSILLSRTKNKKQKT